MPRKDKFDDDEDDGRAEDAAPQSVGRRRALKISLGVAGAFVAATAISTGTRVWQTGAGGNLTGGAGFTPWHDWTSGAAKGLEGIVAAATLAPSTHNSQPWLFSINGNIIDLHADLSRAIGTVDPMNREMAISLGCAVENMVIGAQALGFTPVLNVLPVGPNGNHVARMTLFPGEHTKPEEAAALARRRTHRGLYIRDKTVPTDVIDALYAQTKYTKSRLIWLGGDGPNGKQFAQATLDAAQEIMADEEMRKDSAAWFRPTLASVNSKADGLSLATSGVRLIDARLALMAPESYTTQQLPQQSVRVLRDVQLASAPMFGLITVPDITDRTALVEAGRLWQRLHLTATLKGLAMQPLNQLMEMADRDKALQRASNRGQMLAELAGFADSTVAFGFRLGYAQEPTVQSARRGVKQVMMAG